MNTLSSVLMSMRQKIDTLAERQSSLQHDIDTLRAENDELKRQLKETERSLQNARLEVEFLTVSHRLADSPDTLVEARRFVSRLIRRVDAAIALLRDDPAL